MPHSTLAVALAFAAAAAASPINVSLSGNFGPSLNQPTLFDNQNYLITFTIPDPHSPTTGSDTSDGLVAVRYGTPGQNDMLAELSVPGIGLSVTGQVVVEYLNQAHQGLWMNMWVVAPLPVGSYFQMMPFQTSNGAPLWNGMAWSHGLPEIYPLDAAPGRAHFYLEQTTSDFTFPIAAYEMVATMTASTAVPEPSVIFLMATGLLVISRGSRRNR
jgi:hypothetical protein